MKRVLSAVVTVTLFLCAVGIIEVKKAEAEINTGNTTANTIDIGNEADKTVSLKPETLAPAQSTPTAETQAIAQKPIETKEKKPNPWTIRGRSETIVDWKDYNNESSTIDKDTSWRQELSVNLSRRMKNASMGLDLRGRATDDENVDNKDARLLYLHGYYKNKDADFEIGDVAASFNPLVLSASLKGTKLSYSSGNSEKGWKASFLGGIQKASWDDIYSSDNKDAYDRYIAGIHNENTFGTGKKISFSTAFIKDSDNNSADDLTREDINPAEAATVGTSWDWRFNRYLSTRGEAAFTSCDENKDDDKSDKTAGAVRIKVMTTPHKKYLKSNFLYERIETDFKPITASAAADREKFENDSTIMINRKVKIRLTLKANKDNLDGALGQTRKTDDGVFYLSLRPDWLKRGDFGLRHQFKRTHGRGTDDVSNMDQRLNIHQADFSISPKSGWKYGLSWIYTDINENTEGMEDQDIHTLRTTIGWKKSFGKDHQFRSTFRIDGNHIERDSDKQKSAGGQIDIGYDAGKIWSADLSAGTKKTFRDMADDGQYTAYEIRANYHPGGDSSKALRLSAAKRQTFTDSETTSTENTAKLSYLFSF